MPWHSLCLFLICCFGRELKRIGDTVNQNISYATVAALRDLLQHGATLTVRGQEVRELVNRVTVLASPCERCLFVPKRANNVFASIAETMWVLGGRDDIAWLETYLPRAKEFSDDGVTWRAAYGPRLRNWSGIDQLDQIRRLLLADGSTRRAVMSLYDPRRDFVESKDIPCNNWLHWLIRDGSLNLNIAVRSNDVIWGFSGVNAFEFSVLQQIMAFWLKSDVGRATYFASSFHLYSRHYERAAEIISAFPGITCYDVGIPSPAFATEWSDFDSVLRHWFDWESEIRRSPDTCSIPSNPLGDPLLDGALQMCRVFQGAKVGWSPARIAAELAALPSTDLTAAAYEHFGRKDPTLLHSIPQPAIASFFAAYASGNSESTQSERLQLLPSVIKSLHYRKDAAYGASWKKRGELTSILANIARKADRLDVFVRSGAELYDESIFDTAIDLFVYVTKYRLFLMESTSVSDNTILPLNAPTPYSDHAENFDVLVDLVEFREQEKRTLVELVSQMQAILGEIHNKATSVGYSAENKLVAATQLSNVAVQVIVAVVEEVPGGLEMLREFYRRSVPNNRK